MFLKNAKSAHDDGQMRSFLEVPGGFEPPWTVLQTVD